MRSQVCPECGDFVYEFTKCPCLRLSLPAGGVKPVNRPPANPDVSREAQLEQCLALARDALNNSSDIVFKDITRQHLRDKALADINKLIGPATWPFN